MMFIEIEGTRDQIRGLHDISGVEVRGSEDLGGGRFRARGFVQRAGAVADIEARGLTVRVTLDENEVQRRIQQERDEIKRAAEDAGASAEPTRKESEPKGSV